MKVLVIEVKGLIRYLLKNNCMILQYKASLVLIFLLIISELNSFSQSTNHWETIVQTGDNCKYYIPKSDIGSSWKSKDFQDDSWITAKSGVGFGDNDDNTVISTGISTVYIRYTFNIQNISDITSLVLDIDFDDGFIAYLNGTEVARENVNNPVQWNMKLSGLHEASMYKGGKPDRFVIGNFRDGLLKNGENVLAVEVHNESSTSSDLSSNIYLHAGMSTPEMMYGSTPDWFWEPVNFTGYNLPLVIINTNGLEIPDEPRIVAEMGIINNGEGKTNKETDNRNEYSGKINIERRGESSSGFKKKSYSLELQKGDGSNNNVSILGLPEENDFVLYGPYSDKTMIKNVLSYQLFGLTGRWAPRTRYVEVILNGDYRGVYVLTEKLKRDENRVDIDKLTSDDVSAVDISGGYILRRDKKNKLSAEDYWTSPVAQPYHETMWYEYYDPEFKDLTEDQANYIKNWMEEFDNVMSGYDFADPETGYSKYIKTKSFIDMMFLNEISKGIDNYMFSTYFHKENDEDGGQLVAGPPWDYNIGYGNVNYGQDWNAAETYGWGYPQGSRTYWFERLMEDEEYRNKVYCRWTKFRDSIYSDENIVAIIDSCVTVLGPAVDRNFEKYPILGEYFWPAIYWPDTYEEEIDNLKTWLIDRLQWMDGEWYNMGECEDETVNANDLVIAELQSAKVYPNPSDFSSLNFELLVNNPLNELIINIYDLQGRLIRQQIRKHINPGVNLFQFPNLSHYEPGIYIYKIYSSTGIIDTGKLSKY
jgi:hypothetical protein